MKNIIKVLLLVSLSTAYASQTPSKGFVADVRCKQEKNSLFQRCMNQLPGSHGRPSGQITVAAFCYGVAYAQFVSCMERNKNSVITQ